MKNIFPRLVLFLVILFLCPLQPGSARAQTNPPPTTTPAWQEAFSQMPLAPGVRTLAETNCVPVTLKAFKRNAAVKALIFTPGATDEFYFFHRANVTLTNEAPTLRDAIVALTNQTRIHVATRDAFLILHTDEDYITPVNVIEDPRTAERIKQARFKKEVLYDDRDWDYMQPILAFRLNTEMRPKQHVTDSYHFFRHSFAAYDLTGWEALEAVATAGKTRFTIQKRSVLFQADNRIHTPPPPPTATQLK
jgi:hypothetical protein